MNSSEHVSLNTRSLPPHDIHIPPPQYNLQAIKATLHIATPIRIFLFLLPFGVIFWSLFIGRYEVEPLTVVKMLISQVYPIEHTWTNADETILFQVRLPRVIAAVIVGAALSMAGAAYQGLFKNPLVSPDILGVSSGAGFGAALAILFSTAAWMIQISAFIGGILAVLASYFLSRLYKNGQILVLVLSGVIVSAFFGALLSITKYVADPYEKLPTIIFWLMGSLSSVRYNDILAILPAIIFGGGVLILIRWRINLLSLSQDEAKTLGIDLKKITRIIIICATLLTAASVCISGIIGWVGLVVPHLGRMITGPDYKKLLPLTIVMGASYLLIMDDLSRTIIATEIPLGILTALLGAPFFAYLLWRRKTGWV
ncbi:iron ABC transporter permease [Methanospirillum purgamenti]|jgi:iron complex transport system permease protein|uniref:Cobalamin import system permease protein BtuC n=1 Tax=Methanospirillum hungatei TaxID=2203 RepID=A0A8F5VJH2_METHU|nr:iron ABC transporter permease [Methanospirillum hungatei]QXO94142.1 iron ABC transporter permease [Methanospirillum hungatei]